MKKEIEDDNFTSEVLETKNVVLVDFWAEWCGPCKMLAPVIDELSKELAAKVTIYKMNVDDNPKTPSELGVRGIPTMILFKDGKQIGTKVGALPKSALKEWIESLI